MNGNSHAKVGLAAGAVGATAAFVIFGDVGALEILYSSYIGARLPDFDHHNTKGGKFIALLKRILTWVIVVSLVIVFGCWLYEYFTSKKIPGYDPVSATVGLVVVGVLLAFTRIPILKRALHFATKHRGLWHTSLPVVALLLAGNGAVVGKNSFYGMAIGYASHLFADMLTDRGAPVAWPIYRGNVNIAHITTGDTAEVVAANVLSLLLLVVCGLIQFIFGGN